MLVSALALAFILALAFALLIATMGWGRRRLPWCRLLWGHDRRGVDARRCRDAGSTGTDLQRDLATSGNDRLGCRITGKHSAHCSGISNVLTLLGHDATVSQALRRSIVREANDIRDDNCLSYRP